MPKRNASKHDASSHRHFSVKKCLIALGIILLFLVIIVPSLAVTLFMHRHIDYRGKETKNYPLQGIYKAEDYNLSETIHTFTTSDQESIWCSEIKSNSPKGVVIYLTGIAQPSITYFYGHAAWMLQNDFSSFLMEVRSHGSSTGNLIGLGYTEVPDVQAVVNYIKSCKEYDGLPIIIHGVSMGGAISLNSFGQIPEIDACIAMSPYASFETQLDLLLAEYHIPEFLRKFELPILRQTLKWIYGNEAVETLAPQVQIQNADSRPVLLIACSGDVAVPVQNTKILKSTYPQADVWIRDSWEHFIVKGCDFKHVIDDTEYTDKILSWISANVMK